MKKLLLVVVAVLVLAVISVLVGRHYDSYKNQKNQQEVAKVQAAEQAQAQQKAHEVHDAKVQAAYDHERIECEKGKAAYDTLTAAQKASSKVPAPTCGTAVIQ